MVNTPRVDGLARIPGLTSVSYKTHPHSLNSVPPCLVWRIGFGQAERLTIWWIEITNCPSTKEIWLTYQIRENCWYIIIIFFNNTGTASTHSKSCMATYQCGVVTGCVTIILLCVTSITSKHTFKQCNLNRLYSGSKRDSNETLTCAVPMHTPQNRTNALWWVEGGYNQGSFEYFAKACGS